MKNLMKKSLSVAVTASVAGLLSAGAAQAVSFEVWAPDQSNSVGGGAGAGTDGGYINIWEGTDVTAFLAAAPDAVANPAPATLACDGGATPGPCDVHSVFPGTLVAAGSTNGAIEGATLSSLGGLGRVHGMIPDPQQYYFNVNFFVPNKSYIGIMDGRTKSAVALFRVTDTTASGSNASSVHMSYWNGDGTQLLVANLHGRILERINIGRDKDGNITSAEFDKSASLSVADLSVTEEAFYFTGNNGAGVAMESIVTSSVAGAYSADGLSGSYTDQGGAGTEYCKQNGCASGTAIDGARGGNVIVCPIVTSNNKAFITFGGGGLLVADTDSTPMSIVGGYGNTVVNGAGCGGVEIGGFVYLNAGASAAGSGGTQSTFGVYKMGISFGDGTSDTNAPHTENLPAPQPLAFNINNTQTIGNTTGTGTIFEGGAVDTNLSGQTPGTSTRSDGHGMTPTMTGNALHVVDRIQNTATSIKIANDAVDTYSLTGGGCATYGVTDDAGLPADDAAPDLMATGPNNQYLYVALRGPRPVTVGHNAQGSCPGVGVIALNKSNDDTTGTMTHVIRTSNTVDTTAAIAYGTVAGGSEAAGHNYTGAERSDIHGVALRIKSD